LSQASAKPSVALVLTSDEQHGDVTLTRDPDIADIPGQARNQFRRLAGIRQRKGSRKPSEPPRHRDAVQRLRFGSDHYTAIRCIEITVGVAVRLPIKVAKRWPVFAQHECRPVGTVLLQHADLDQLGRQIGRKVL
jgi:hypothetical protein